MCDPEADLTQADADWEDGREKLCRHFPLWTRDNSSAHRNGKAKRNCVRGGRCSDLGNDPEIARLLGVVAVDVNMLADISTVRASSDWSSFWVREDSLLHLL